MTQSDGRAPEAPHGVDPLFEAIAEEMAAWLGDDSTGHDIAHGWRVFHTAMELADDYPHADREVLGAAALTHDIHRAMGAAAGEFVHPEESLDEVEAVLAAVDFPPEKRDAVLHCVALHEEYEFREDDQGEASEGASSAERSSADRSSGRGPREDGEGWRPASRDDRRDGDRIEVDLLRDADNLDAMGAVGVARCFVYTGAHDRPMWTPDSDEPSAIDHFHEKLLNLNDEMHTDAAREVAESRHDFLETFLERFEDEWYGRA
ncbi:metal-dependent phosphohydrolase [Natronomonas halophila]|nr:metal-dependent phosphohydrolase [Natronomonas halophila]